MTKEHSKSWYKKELWKWFSKYIRLRDKRVCITCGRIVPPEKPQGYHAGHCEPKSICPLCLYFSEKNVNGQCYNCNINLGGWGARYRKRVDEKWGVGTYEAIEKMKIEFKGQQWTIDEYLDKIKEYKEKVKCLTIELKSQDLEILF